MSPTACAILLSLVSVGVSTRPTASPEPAPGNLSRTCEWCPDADGAFVVLSCRLATDEYVTLSRLDAEPAPAVVTPWRSKNVVVRRYSEGVWTYNVTIRRSWENVGLYRAEVRGPFFDVGRPSRLPFAVDYALGAQIQISVNRQRSEDRVTIFCLVRGRVPAGVAELEGATGSPLISAAFNGTYSASLVGARTVRVLFEANDTLIAFSMFDPVPGRSFRCTVRPAESSPRKSVSGWLHVEEVRVRPWSRLVRTARDRPDLPPVRIGTVCCRTRLLDPAVRAITWWWAPDECSRSWPLHRVTGDWLPALRRSSPSDVEWLEVSWRGVLRSEPGYAQYSPRQTETCLERIDGGHLDSGVYGCAFETTSGDAYHRFIVVQEVLDITLRQVATGTWVDCTFFGALEGRLDVERVEDGNVLYTLNLRRGLGLRVGSAGRVSYENGQVKASVYLIEDGTRYYGTRCRVTTPCGVLSSRAISPWNDPARRQVTDAARLAVEREWAPCQAPVIPPLECRTDSAAPRPSDLPGLGSWRVIRPGDPEFDWPLRVVHVIASGGLLLFICAALWLARGGARRAPPAGATA